MGQRVLGVVVRSVVLAVILAVALGGRAAGAPAGGGLIVFDSTRDGANRLYAVRPDGTGLRRLGPTGTVARVSPDGSKVVFSDLSERLRVLDVATGSVSKLAGFPDVGLGWDFTEWPWSPDSRHFAIGDDAGLVVFPASGGAGTRITDGSDSVPAWSPDGKRIAFSDSTGGVSVVDVDGSNRRQLVASGDDPEWSPDGTSIAFTRLVGGDVVTFVVAADGGTARRVAVGFQAWSPDGRTLAIAAEGGLALYDRDGDRTKTLLRGRGAQDATWSPDGRSVIAVVDGDLWRFAADGTGVTRLTEGARFGYANEDPSLADASSSVAGTLVTAATVSGGPLVALSRTRGALVTRFPRVSGIDSTNSGPATVYALADDGRGGWFVGGDFADIGGIDCPNLAHITARQTVDRRWCSKPNGPIRSLVRLGSTLFVGGENLTRVGVTPRRGLAAYDTRTGRLTAWSPNVDGDIYGLMADPQGTTLYFFGLFRRVGGVARANLAAVDVHTGAPTGFAPDPDATAHGDSVAVIAVTRSRVFAAGYFSRIGGKSTGRKIGRAHV